MVHLIALQADLDSDPVIRGRPVVLQSKDCHALWVSQRALDSSLPFPEEIDGGLIIRDDSGNPTGMCDSNLEPLYLLRIRNTLG